MFKCSQDFFNSLEFTEKCRSVLNNKKSLISLYNNFYDQVIAEAVKNGPTLEIGCGPSFLNKRMEIITSDRLRLPWVDLVLSSDSIPFKQEKFSNIVLIHVLHHLGKLNQSIREIGRVLKPGGRVIIIDHQLGLLSFLFMRFIHHENFSLDVTNHGNGKISSGYANTAIAYSIIQKDARCWDKEGLRLVKINYHTLFSYLLTCGFHRLNLLPGFLIGPISRFDRLLFNNNRKFCLLMTAVFQKEK